MSVVTIRATLRGETRTIIRHWPEPEDVMGFVADRVTYQVEGKIPPKVREVLEGCYVAEGS